VLNLIAAHPELVSNGIAHKVAINADYINGKSESLLPNLCAQCKTIFWVLMNEDQAAWDELGKDYHARLERNYVTWVRQYVSYAGPLPAFGPADFTNRPLGWTIGGSPRPWRSSATSNCTALGISVGLLPCKHFPQVSIPDQLADHIRHGAWCHLS
jgi:hypothetical protein